MTNLTNYIEYTNDLYGELYVVQSCNPETGLYDVADIVSDPRAALEILLAEEAKGMIASMRATNFKDDEDMESEFDYPEHKAYEDWSA